jgi:4-amino-4-deoxychorismate lyase
MSRFIEAIKLKDGEFYRLKYHQQRVEETFKLFFPEIPVVNLEAHLQIIAFPEKGTYKCRIVYDAEIRQFEFIPYELRSVQTLKLIEINIESTVYKPEDRTAINQAFSQRGECDDVLLVRNGLLTDTSYSNIALFNGQEWMTPRVPLLYGTQRACLIENKMITEAEIPAVSLRNYQKIRLFNAMIEFGELEFVIDVIHNPLTNIRC